MQSEIKQPYLWSIPQILLASYLAGPMAGCYFLGKNFQQLNSLDHAKKCYLAGMIASVLLLTILFLLPEDLASIPSFCIPAVVSSVIVSYAHCCQKPLVQDSLNKGAKRFSYGWCILMMLALVVIQVPLFFLYAILFATIF